MVVNYEDVEAILRALSDCTRREILAKLRDGELSVGEIHRDIYLTKPTISHHLSQLHKAKLVKSQRSGGYNIYQLNPYILDETIFYLQELRGDFEKKKQK